MAPPPAQLVEVRLRAGHKLLIVGQNQSGKSVLATSIAARFDRVLIYDPKDDPNALIPNCRVAYTVGDALRGLPGRVLWRPRGAEMRRVDRLWDDLCSKVLDDVRNGRGATAIVVHETMDLGDQWHFGPAHSEVIRKGASLGLTAVEVSQRINGIPVQLRSEAQHLAAFTLLDDGDRQTLAGLMGRPVADAPLPLDFTWWYRGPDLRLVHARALPL